MTDVAKTRGIGFVNVRSFVTGRFGVEGWEKTVARLTNEERADLEAVVAVGWYSLPLYARLIRALDAVHGKADLALLPALGRFEAETDLTTIYRFILRLANPAFVIEKTGELWRRYHDTGTWTMTRVSNTEVEGILENWGHVDEALCLEALAYMERCLELVGARNVIAEHPRCRARGDADCLFRGRWGSVIVRDSRPPARTKPADGPKITSRRAPRFFEGLGEAQTEVRLTRR